MDKLDKLIEVKLQEMWSLTEATIVIPNNIRDLARFNYPECINVAIRLMDRCNKKSRLFPKAGPQYYAKCIRKNMNVCDQFTPEDQRKCKSLLDNSARQWE